MEHNAAVKNKTRQLLVYGLLLFFTTYSNISYAVVKNQAASISKATIPANLKPSKTFMLSVTARDDKAVTGIKIKYLNKTQVIKARTRGKKVVDFKINLKAPRTGKQRIEITALDGSKLQTKARIVIVDVSRVPTAKVTKTINQQQTNVVLLNRAQKPIKKLTSPFVLSRNTTVKELEKFVQNQKNKGRSIFQAAKLLKDARVAGDKAYQALLNIYNSPIEFVANVMQATGYGLSSFVGKFAETARSKTLGWLFKALVDAGYDLDEITFDLKGIKNFSLQTATKTWQLLGKKADRVVGMLKDRFGINASNAFSYMKNAGYSAADVVSAIKDKFNPTGRQMVKWMNNAAYSGSSIVQTIKAEFNSSALQLGGWLKDAGFSATQIATVLKSNFSTSATQMISLLVDLGYNLNQIRSTIASVFSMGLVQVGSLIASLGF